MLHNIISLSIPLELYSEERRVLTRVGEYSLDCTYANLSLSADLIDLSSVSRENVGEMARGSGRGGEYFSF